MMEVARPDQAGLHDIRSQLAAAGAQMRPATDLAMIARVLRHVGDAGLAVDAILMTPRPQWLSDLIGNDLCRLPAQPPRPMASPPER